MTDEHSPSDGEPAPIVEVASASAIEPEEVAYAIAPEDYETFDTDAELFLPIGLPSMTPSVDMSPALDAIRSLGESLGKRIDGLASQFDREIRAEATREKVVDRLHAELQQYKQDLLLNTLRPMFVDLIQLHDDIGKMVEAHAEVDGDAVRLLDVMRGFQQGIEDILYRQGVEPFSLDGDAFDPRRQRAVATVPAEEPELAKRIAVRHRKGFQAGEKVIRPEIVSVYAVKKGGG